MVSAIRKPARRWERRTSNAREHHALFFRPIGCASLQQHRIPELVRPVAMRFQLAVGCTQCRGGDKCPEKRVMARARLVSTRQHRIDDAQLRFSGNPLRGDAGTRANEAGPGAGRLERAHERRTDRDHAPVVAGTRDGVRGRAWNAIRLVQGFRSTCWSRRVYVASFRHGCERTAQASVEQARRASREAGSRIDFPWRFSWNASNP